MTTIAYRDGVLAADTAVSDCDCHVASTAKITKGPNGVMGGLTGTLADGSLFLAWIRSGAEGEPPEFKADDSEGVLIHPDGRVEWVGAKKQRAEMDAPFYAIGSGFRVALGAMHAGATAERAVEIAALVDVYTRLPLTVLRLGA